MERTFKRGENTRVVSSPVEAVRLRAAGWIEQPATEGAVYSPPTDITPPDTTKSESAPEGDLDEIDDAGDTPDAA